MREIKFRAFHRLTRTMLSAMTLQDLILSGSPRIPINELEFLQYTGLKDKNGVEIYEGDIVADRHLNGVDETVGEVKYFTRIGSICGWKVGKFFYMSSMSREIEVIGNIYENPELLEGGE